MIVEVIVNDHRYRLGQGIDISVPVDFRGPQANAYGVSRATSWPYSGEGFVLDTTQGGACNCEVIQLTPHCHGTHTECVGHVTRERNFISSSFPNYFIASTLITVAPEGRHITKDLLKAALAPYLNREGFLEGLILRTTPNSRDKLTRSWQDSITPYFLPEAISYLLSCNVQHLVVDLPSLDPMVDGGKLVAHRVFWDMEPGSMECQTTGKHRTITELVYVPNSICDGSYILSLQIPHLASDAAPSRPILFELENIV